MPASVIKEARESYLMSEGQVCIRLRLFLFYVFDSLLPFQIITKFILRDSLLFLVRKLLNFILNKYTYLIDSVDYLRQIELQDSL
jgi:hypothetical protein